MYWEPALHLSQESSIIIRITNGTSLTRQFKWMQETPDDIVMDSMRHALLTVNKFNVDTFPDN